MSIKLTQNQLAQRYPFTPFPNSWYRIEKVANIPKGQRKSFFFFGRKLILTRSSIGELKLNDEKQNFPVIEKNKLIFAYFDQNGNEPFFEVPEVQEFTDSNWMQPFNLNWKIKVHAQEIAENALDLAHFIKVHTYLDIPILSCFELKGPQMEVKMQSRRSHVGQIVMTSMKIVYHGIGIVVADTDTDKALNLKVLLTITPIDTQTIDLNMEVAIKKTWNPFRNLFFRLLMPREIFNEFYRDIPIWESKIYHSAPVLCSVESNIIRVRNWAKQFYFCAAS